MYNTRIASRLLVRKDAILLALAFSLPVTPLGPPAAVAQIEVTPGQYNRDIIRKISERSERLELTTNSSRILTLDTKIPRIQVNNPELLEVTPLSDREISISAKKAGVTQINLWDEDGQIHMVDVLIYGDAQELEHALQIQFPDSAIKVYRYSESLVLKGFVDRPDVVSQIIRLAEDYAPKVINNITVGGVQQILLKVKVMEVSRTKLRRLGVDWAYGGSNGGFVINSVNEILNFDGTDTVFNVNTAAETFGFGIVHTDSFFSFMDALQENRVAKILAEPNLVAVSGRPAKFMSGGEFAYLVAQGGVGQTTFTVQWREFGTIVDFVPIVLGNGNIRLEVRPEVSTIDFTLGTASNGTNIPGLRKRFVETAVEMKAGQTFAIAGLVDERVDTFNRGLPILSDIPVFGLPFRRVEDEINEVELLIMVTPEFVDGMDPHEVPCGGPGIDTVSPTNKALYLGGHIEVPQQCNPFAGPGACNNCGPYPLYNGGMPAGNGVIMPGGTGYDNGDQYYSQPVESGPTIETLPGQPQAEQEDLTLPPIDDSTMRNTPSGTGLAGSMAGPYAPPSAPRTYSPNREPVYLRNANNPQNQYGSRTSDSPTGDMPALIGPIGYDVQ